MSRAYVDFEGGSQPDQAAAQAALDAEINSNTWVGHVNIRLRWEKAGWRVLEAKAMPSAVTTGLSPMPKPWDATEEIVRVLRVGGVPVAGVGLRLEEGRFEWPDEWPDDPHALLDLMQDVSTRASEGAGVGNPTFDHNMRIFQMVKARFDYVVAHELGRSHKSLEVATEELSRATKWLTAATVVLALVTLGTIAAAVLHGP